MNTETETLPADLATTSRNGYRGFDNRRGAGWNVYLNGAGMILMGLPESWANKAAKLLNACATANEQRAELARIRAAVAHIPTHLAA